MSIAGPPTEGGQTPERARLDVWLWRARFCKSRALAADLIASGAVRLARGASVRRVEKAASPVGAGDVLVIAGPGGPVRTVRILALGVRRGPAAEARRLYAEETGSLDER